MATVLEKKNGGPYSKNEQEKRRNQVYILHFEKGYTAVRIAYELRVNRNTISEDIKYWYSTIKEDTRQDGGEQILKQIGRLEAQRSRIVQKVTENQTKDSIKYEKMLLEMDNRINNVLFKIHSTQSKDNPTKESISMEEALLEKEKIKGIILFLLIKYNTNYCLTEEQILCEIINLGKKTVKQSSSIFSDLEEEGLDHCKKIKEGDVVYDLMEFAQLCRYVLPNESFVINVHALYISDMQHKEELRKLRTKFVERYGAQKTWNEKTYTEYNKEKEDTIEDFANSHAKLVAESLREKLDSETIKEYTKYMKVFFGDEKTTYEKILRT